MPISRSPQSPSEVLIDCPDTSVTEVARVFEKARTAQRRWAATPAAARAEALAAAANELAANADELADLVMREVGKPLSEAVGEVARCVSILRYYSQQVFDPVGALHEPSAAGLLFTRRRPRGVAGLITPWNFPVAIPLWKAVPALAFGNAVVLKPATDATACSLRLEEILNGFLPDDVFTVVPGGGNAGRAVVDAADVVSFTGSTAVGQAVANAAGARGVPVQAEMGGQNPAIVVGDADFDRAAAQIAAAAMGYAGQKCTATKRVITVGRLDEFRDALVAAVEGLVVGDPADSKTAVGPLIGEAARDQVVSAARSAAQDGGTVLTGGEKLERDGWFVAPTLVEGVGRDHQLACEEVFGPIALLQQADSLEDAVSLANSVPHGLAAGIYTSDLASALSASADLHAGLVKVNAPTSGVDFYMPFGGDKESSIGGREQGKAAQEFYTSTSTVTIAP